MVHQAAGASQQVTVTSHPKMDRLLEVVRDHFTRSTCSPTIQFTSAPFHQFVISPVHQV